MIVYLNAVFIVVIFCLSLVKVNDMTGDTNHALRLCYVLMSIGAFGMFVAFLNDSSTPSSEGVIFHAGIAVGLVGRRQVDAAHGRRHYKVIA